MATTEQEAPQAIKSLVESGEKFDGMRLTDLTLEQETNSQYEFIGTVEFESLEDFAATDSKCSQIIGSATIRVIPNVNPVGHSSETGEIYFYYQP